MRGGAWCFIAASAALQPFIKDGNAAIEWVEIMKLRGYPVEVNAVTEDRPDGPWLSVTWSWPDGIFAADDVQKLAARWFAHHGWNVLAVDLPGHCRSEGEPPRSVALSKSPTPGRASSMDPRHPSPGSPSRSKCWIPGRSPSAPARCTIPTTNAPAPSTPSGAATPPVSGRSSSIRAVRLATASNRTLKAAVIQS